MTSCDLNTVRRGLQMSANRISGKKRQQNTEFGTLAMTVAVDRQMSTMQFHEAFDER